MEIEGELHAGKRGYLHGGLGIIAPLGQGQEIGFVSHHRHPIAFTPEVKLSPCREVFAGIQPLRGDGPDNNLAVTGEAFSF